MAADCTCHYSGAGVQALSSQAAHTSWVRGPDQVYDGVQLPGLQICATGTVQSQ